MALFNFGKKNEEQKTPACACNGGCPASEAESMTHSCCGEAVERGELPEIKIFSSSVIS